MIRITRKFQLGIHPRNKVLISKKLEELDISANRFDYFETEILGEKVVKLYIDCTCDEENMNVLIEYLRDEYRDLASIQY